MTFRAIANGNPNAGWGRAPEMVHNGDLYWLTILGENNLVAFRRWKTLKIGTNYR